MPHEATLQRPKYGLGTYGGTEPTMISWRRNVKCRVNTASMNEINEFDKRDQRVTNRITFGPINPLLKIGDQILVTVDKTDGDITGNIYRIESVSDKSAGTGRLYVAMAELENNNYGNAYEAD